MEEHAGGRIEFVKVFKLIIFSACCGGTLFFLISLFIKYFDYEFSTRISFVNSDLYPLPQMTICQNPSGNNSAAEKYALNTYSMYFERWDFVDQTEMQNALKEYLEPTKYFHNISLQVYYIKNGKMVQENITNADIKWESIWTNDPIFGLCKAPILDFENIKTFGIWLDKGIPLPTLKLHYPGQFMVLQGERLTFKNGSQIWKTIETDIFEEQSLSLIHI